MPVYKYKTFDEARQHLSQLQPDDPLKHLAKLHKIVRALKPPKKFEPGIFKFKTLAEANRHREHL